MDQDLGIALNPLVKLLVCRRSVINIDLVRDDKAGICLSRDDHVSQVPVVIFDVALACANGKTLRRLSAEAIIHAYMAAYLLEQFPKAHHHHHHAIRSLLIRPS